MKINKSVVVSLWGIGLLWMLSTTNISAQEYKYEIGSALGTSFYMGDANRTKFFLHPGLAGGILFRYNFNLLWSVKTDLFAGNIAGKSINEEIQFPFENQVDFQRSFAELGAQVEFNFFPYSDKYSYLGTKPFTPYLFTGVGITTATGDRTFFDANIPIGMGLKYKLKNRMNIGAEFSFRKLLRDDFDVTEKTTGWNLESPYGIKSSFLKNQDWYAFAMIFLTWEFKISEDPCPDY